MFRSVFSKLTAVFMIIIVACFTMLAFIITTIAGGYSITIKEGTMNDIASSASRYIEREISRTEDLFEDESEIDVLRSLLTLPINHSDVFAFVTDKNGRVLFCDSNSAADYTGKVIPAPQTAQATSPEGYTGMTTLGGIFNRSCLVCALPVNGSDNTVVAAVFIYSANSAESALLASLVRTIVLSTMWVLIAMLLAIFFVSERMIGPLKGMSRAAKQFAAGKLDVRVPVTGNDEITELSASFNSMAEALASLESLRRTFLGNVSHDLRTPMTTISGFVDGILDGTIPKDKEEYYLKIVSSETKRLSRLVTALLDVSRIQAGERKFTPQQFDICELARQIIISFEQQIDAKRLDVRFECERDSMLAFADRDAIHQVLYNICDNAVKFSRDSGILRLRIFVSERRIHVAVFNEGIGIPPADVPHVFDRFYKSDKSRGLDKTGVGLGMYIARSVMEAQNESISVRSAYGENCEFEFTLKEAK